ncbi:MAG TPA: hypothetical protein VGV87_24950 [Blastocatellia bacterium]|jgi:photosystem II stability/assembly factor-like uncharacterized protein|nr:hypothetical protein [Blastocatellia bacterium]
MVSARSLTATALAVLLAGAQVHPQFKHQTSGTTAQLRGISAASSRIVWASGSKGTYVRTTNGGRTWVSGTVPDASSLDFRDVEAINAKTAYLLATAGRIYKTIDGGRRWSLQYNNTAQGVFLDAFAFWDARHGIVLGDPINDGFLLLTTNNGGLTWKQVPSAGIPPAIKGEAAFAASGTCIAVEGKNNVWFATGGKAARVFRSTDRGRTWKVSNTPIISGEDSTGIFSIAFKDAKNGFVVGGDYRKPIAIGDNVARTTDGGVTWKLVEGARPNGFRSCVEYVGRTSTLIAVGERACDYSTDDGASWKSFGREGYHCASIASSRAAWAAGADGRIAAITFTKSD